MEVEITDHPDVLLNGIGRGTYTPGETNEGNVVFDVLWCGISRYTTQTSYVGVTPGKTYNLVCSFEWSGAWYSISYSQEINNQTVTVEDY